MSTTQTNANVPNSESRGSSAPKLTKEQVSQLKVQQEVDAVRKQLSDAASCDKLNDFERGFLADMSTKFRQYGAKTRLTLKQVMVINRTLCKACLA